MKNLARNIFIGCLFTAAGFIWMVHDSFRENLLKKATQLHDSGKYPEAKQKLENAANQGVAAAQYNLGVYYQNG